MPESRCKERKKGWEGANSLLRRGRLNSYGPTFKRESRPTKTKYDEFHNAVGTVPRSRAVITMLYSSEAPELI